MPQQQKSNVNEKYLELQILNQQIRQLQQHIANLENQVMELEVLEDNLEEIKKVKEGGEILVSLGAGIFAKANLKDNKKVIMNVGANTMVKKEIDEAKKIVKDQIDQVKDLIEDITLELEKAAVRVQSTQREIQSMIENTKKQ
ncbi:MAG: prefoldin subunit alpha [Candidatus Nanoarchaeia archaeon]